jgi:hypothetical protein
MVEGPSAVFAAVEEILVASAAETSAVFATEVWTAFTAVTLVDFVAILATATDLTLASSPIGDTRTGTDMARGGALTRTTVRTIPTTTRTIAMTLLIIIIGAIAAIETVVTIVMRTHVDPMTKVGRPGLRTQACPRAPVVLIM